jgi:uncharacterized protein YbgA (DUF1722 family)
MISKAQVIKNHPEYKTLINAVINRIGLDNVENVNIHGISGGFAGFIYYSETHAFAMRYRKLIVKLLEDQAEQLGEEVVEMVSNFGYFRSNGKSTMDNEDRKELYKYLGGGKCEQSIITNLMAWFAAEEVCHMFDN